MIAIGIVKGVLWGSKRVDQPREGSSVIWDAIIIGAGPAGLTAAGYLGRFRRSALVLHDEKSRARWIPTSHNTPGFPEGVGGGELLARLECQARRYGAKVQASRVTQIIPEDGGFVVSAEDESYRSRFVVLATGVADKLPPLDGIVAAVERGIMRICPICDAYEAIGLSIGVLGDGDHGVREAQFLTSFSTDISLIHVGAPLANAVVQGIAASGIVLRVKTLHDVHIGDRGVTVESDDETLRFDVCYAALGCSPQNALVSSLNAVVDDAGALRVNPHQETSIPGIYAAGDVVKGLNQIIVAAAEAAVAATDIHNRLRTL